MSQGAPVLRDQASLRYLDDCAPDPGRITTFLFSEHLAVDPGSWTSCWGLGALRTPIRQPTSACALHIIPRATVASEQAVSFRIVLCLCSTGCAGHLREVHRAKRECMLPPAGSTPSQSPIVSQSLYTDVTRSQLIQLPPPRTMAASESSWWHGSATLHVPTQNQGKHLRLPDGPPARTL